MSYTNRSDDIHNKPIEEAFIKEEELHNAGGVLHNAVYMNKESFLKDLLEIPSYDVNAVNTNGRTPLHLAAKYGRKDMVEMLLNKEAKVDVVDNRGRTPLHFAAKNGHKEVVKALLDKGANVNTKDNDEKTPFDLATAKGIKTLLQNTAELLEAVKNNSVEEVERLINEGANVNAGDNDGQTPLHFAAANSKKEVVELLLKAKGINVNAKDRDGNTPLDLTTNEEIKTLLRQAAENTDDVPVDESSTDNEGDSEEEEEQVVEAQPTEQKTVSSGPPSIEPEVLIQNSGSSVGGTPPSAEEQPSSFFGSLFSILMKPFSLIASFVGVFFSWLFGSDEEKTDESTSQTDASVSLPKLDSLDEKKIDAQPGNHSSLAPNQSAGQTDAPQSGADDNQPFG